MKKLSIIDLMEQIDPVYVEEAANYNAAEQSGESADRTAPAPDSRPVHQERRSRPRLKVAAAVLTLILAVGAAALFLHNKARQTDPAETGPRTEQPESIKFGLSNVRFAVEDADGQTATMDFKKTSGELDIQWLRTYEADPDYNNYSLPFSEKYTITLDQPGTFFTENAGITESPDLYDSELYNDRLEKS